MKQCSCKENEAVLASTSHSSMTHTHGSEAGMNRHAARQRAYRRRQRLAQIREVLARGAPAAAGQDRRNARGLARKRLPPLMFLEPLTGERLDAAIRAGR